MYVSNRLDSHSRLDDGAALSILWRLGDCSTL